MIEFSFSDAKKTKSEVKIVLLNSNKLDAEKFLTEEETTNLKKSMKFSKFAGELYDVAKIFDGKTTVIAVGTGDKPTALELQTIGGKLVSRLKDYQDCAILVSDLTKSNFSQDEIAFNVALGIDLGGYRFDKYFTKKEDDFYPKTEKIEFFSNSHKFNSQEFVNYKAIAAASRYARDLCNEPANYLTPKVFADDIKRLEYLGLKVEVLDAKKIKSLEMNLLASVAQGSQNEARVVVIKWQGNPNSKEFDFGLVGKGVTFDTGGISIKPSANMEDMKGDMTGAAVVSATLKALALQKSKLNVVAIVGLVENMPSGTATRPGDIVKSMSGQTVEILNTDAEGRLVLADCLWYLQEEFNVDNIIDVATLTGVTALTFGPEYAGVFSNNDKLAKELMRCGEISGEKVWQLPINAAYNKMIDSPIADMKNIGGRYAGGITAACFLQRFVKPKNKWAHLDIAGVDKNETPTPLAPKGATGFGVRLLVETIKNHKN